MHPVGRGAPGPDDPPAGNPFGITAVRLIPLVRRSLSDRLDRYVSWGSTNRTDRYGRVRVRVAFHGFRPKFTSRSFSASHPYLSLKYELIECRRRPDVHFISVFLPVGRARRAGDIPLPGDGRPTVFYSKEQVSPDLERFDWSISFEGSRDGRSSYLPGWVSRINRLGITPCALIRRGGRPLRQPEGHRPCAHVVRNRVPFREKFFDELSRHMDLVSPGRSRDNHLPIGSSEFDKLGFLPHFRFNLAFENERSPGYLTEKIGDAFMAGCIPIYRGDPFVRRTFSPGAFIHVRGEPGFGAAIERVMAPERDPSLRRAMRGEAPLVDNRLPDYATHDTRWRSSSATSMTRSGVEPPRHETGR